MAKLVTNTKLSVSNLADFIGLSTETKPKDAEEGSIFLEVDTSSKFIFCNNEWFPL